MEDFRQWPIFEKADLNELFRLVIITEPFLKERVLDKKFVTLIRAGNGDFGPLFEKGIVLIAAYHPEQEEIIRRVASSPAASAYQAEITAIQELLFDQVGLLECFNDHFKETDTLLHEEVKKNRDGIR